MQQFLKVPGEWLAACGYGSEDRTFPVLRVQNFGSGRTFVTIDRDGHSWQVWVEGRNAILLTVPETSEAEKDSAMKWSYDYSPSRKRAWIVDEAGFTVIGPVLSRAAAKALCRAHNAALPPKMVTRRNLMTGLEYQEAEDTPLCCSPASETYWSM